MHDVVDHSRLLSAIYRHAIHVQCSRRLQLSARRLWTLSDGDLENFEEGSKLVGDYGLSFVQPLCCLAEHLPRAESSGSDESV